MALRKFAPAAGKRLGIFGSGSFQGIIFSPAASCALETQQTNLRSHLLSQKCRSFMCSVSHLNAAERHFLTRSFATSASAQAVPEPSVSKKKGKMGQDRKGSSPKSKLERPIIFECQVCEALCVKRVQQEHFDRGVVIVRCLECRSVNLVADNLGLFKEEGSMQKFLTERGVDVIYGGESSYELLPEDLVKMVQMDEEKRQQQEEKQLQQEELAMV